MPAALCCELLHSPFGVRALGALRISRYGSSKRTNLRSSGSRGTSDWFNACPMTASPTQYSTAKPFSSTLTKQPRLKRMTYGCHGQAQWGLSVASKAVCECIQKDTAFGHGLPCILRKEASHATQATIPASIPWRSRHRDDCWNIMSDHNPLGDAQCTHERVAADFRRYSLGFMESPVPGITPNLDRLAWKKKPTSPRSTSSAGTDFQTQGPTRSEVWAIARCKPCAKTGHKNGAPGGIRTHDLRLRRPLLYPAELLAHINREALPHKWR